MIDERRTIDVRENSAEIDGTLRLKPSPTFGCDQPSHSEIAAQGGKGARRDEKSLGSRGVGNHSMTHSLPTDR